MFNGKSFDKAWGKGGSGFAKNIWGKGGENFFGAMTGKSQAVAAAEEQVAQARAEEQAAQQRANEARAQQEAAQQRAIADRATADAEKAKLQAEAAELQAMLDLAKAQAAADQEAKKVAELKAQLAQFNISTKPDAAASSPLSYEEIKAINDSALEAGIRASKSSPASAAAASLSPIKEVDEDMELGKALSLSEILQQQFKTLPSVQVLMVKILAIAEDIPI